MGLNVVVCGVVFEVIKSCKAGDLSLTAILFIMCEYYGRNKNLNAYFIILFLQSYSRVHLLV